MQSPCLRRVLHTAIAGSAARSVLRYSPLPPQPTERALALNALTEHTICPASRPLCLSPPLPSAWPLRSAALGGLLPPLIVLPHGALLAVAGCAHDLAAAQQAQHAGSRQAGSKIWLELCRAAGSLLRALPLGSVTAPLPMAAPALAPPRTPPPTPPNKGRRKFRRLSTGCPPTCMPPPAAGASPAPITRLCSRSCGAAGFLGAASPAGRGAFATAPSGSPSSCRGSQALSL